MIQSAHIKLLRAAYGETQKEFAVRFNVSLKLVKSWEQGLRQIRGPAVRLFEIYQEKIVNPAKESAKTP